MKPHPKIRKTIKWGGAVVTVLLVVVWIGSGWWALGWRVNSAFSASIAAGEIQIVNWKINGRSARWECSPHPFYLGSRFRFNSPAPPVGTYWSLPIWSACAMACAASASAWRLDTLARRRAKLNLCAKCHYARTGLAVGAVCPECGAASAGG